MLYGTVTTFALQKRLVNPNVPSKPFGRQVNDILAHRHDQDYTRTPAWVTAGQIDDFTTGAMNLLLFLQYEIIGIVGILANLSWAKSTPFLKYGLQLVFMVLIKLICFFRSLVSGRSESVACFDALNID